MVSIYYLSGILGLILIIFGVIAKKRKQEHKFFAIGGICLIIYSISIKDTIFIILEIIFTLTSIYELTKKKKNEKR